jgi:hypothetical protein
MAKKLIRLWRWLRGDWWEVRRCEFPYPEGYATYNPASRTILDTGLTRDRAASICRELNEPWPRKPPHDHHRPRGEKYDQVPKAATRY